MPKPAAPPAPPRIELRPLAELTPYARNPRTHSAGQVEQIARSIERFGWTNPVLIDAKGGIIAGHGRVAAAKLILERGGKIRDHADPAVVPVIALARLTAAERKAYVIADNQLALQAGWDEALLKLELDDLKLDGFDLTLTGFSPDDLAVAMAGADGVGVNALKAFSGQNEYYTPSDYIDAAREVMGGIDLDPASCKMAQETVKAATFYTARDNGLTKAWAGRVWMNPPYASGLIDRFADKLVNECQSGHVSQAVVLVDNRTDTAWFHKLAGACARICFTRGRINFYNEKTKSSSPANGSTFFYFGPDASAFDAVFCRYGFGGPVAFAAA